MADTKQFPEQAQLLRQYREAKAKRLGRHVTVTEAAEGMGVSTATLSNSECGKVVGPDLAHRIAAYYADDGAKVSDFWTPPTLPSQEAAAGWPANQRIKR